MDRSSGATASDVIGLQRVPAERGIDIWIEGGWGVEALLGEQTRVHDDVDIVIEQEHLSSMRSILEGRGFVDLSQADTRPWNFVLKNGEGLKIDVHVIVFDVAGNGIYGPPENGEFYPAAALRARGVIGGVAVRCLSPEFHIANREGHTLRARDSHDVRLLAERFGFDLPVMLDGRFPAEE